MVISACIIEKTEIDRLKIGKKRFQIIDRFTGEAISGGRTINSDYLAHIVSQLKQDTNRKELAEVKEGAVLALFNEVFAFVDLASRTIGVVPSIYFKSNGIYRQINPSNLRGETFGYITNSNAPLPDTVEEVRELARSRGYNSLERVLGAFLGE